MVSLTHSSFSKQQQVYLENSSSVWYPSRRVPRLNGLSQNSELRVLYQIEKPIRTTGAFLFVNGWKAAISIKIASCLIWLLIDCKLCLYKVCVCAIIQRSEKIWNWDCLIRCLSALSKTDNGRGFRHVLEISTNVNCYSLSGELPNLWYLCVRFVRPTLLLILFTTLCSVTTWVYFDRVRMILFTFSNLVLDLLVFLKRYSALWLYFWIMDNAFLPLPKLLALVLPD